MKQIFSFSNWNKNMDDILARQAFISKAEDLFARANLVVNKCFVEWDNENEETIIHIVAKVKL